MKHYSLLYLISATLEPNQIDEVKKQVSAILKKYEVKIIKEHEVEKRKLAFAIRGVRHGIYFPIDFDAEANKIMEINKELKLTDNILRFMLVSEKTFEKKPKPIRPVQPKDESTTEETESKETEAEPAKPESKKEKSKSKLNLEELDKKIDEILDN